jgi:hypothetical protein
MSPTERTDIFPSTHATWLHTRIESVCDTDTATSALAARELREYLMLRYHKPLCAYVRGSSLRTLGEPEELVHEFFARALADDMFLVRWKARGNPLRRWMMNGLLLHARGVVRDRARNREHSGKNPSVIDSIAQSSEPSAEQAFESAWAMAMLDAACQDVQDSFAKDDRARPSIFFASMSLMASRIPRFTRNSVSIQCDVRRRCVRSRVHCAIRCWSDCARMA